jgi:hypothetical protein
MLYTLMYLEEQGISFDSTGEYTERLVDSDVLLVRIC